MFKLSKHITKAGMIVISCLLSIIFILFLWGFLSAESFNWNDFGMFMLIFTGVLVSFWAVFKIFRMINGLGDKQ
jgi:ABC-type nickel/cobalt efflux system permease component RcnA